MIQRFSGTLFPLLAPLDSAPGLAPFSNSLSFLIISFLQLPQLSSLKAKRGKSVSLKAQTKILELRLIGSDWPDLGHMPTVEPVTGGQRPHALLMLRGRTGRSRGRSRWKNQPHRETHLPPWAGQGQRFYLKKVSTDH